MPKFLTTTSDHPLQAQYRKKLWEAICKVEPKVLQELDLTFQGVDRSKRLALVRKSSSQSHELSEKIEQWLDKWHLPEWMLYTALSKTGQSAHWSRETPSVMDMLGSSAKDFLTWKPDQEDFNDFKVRITFILKEYEKFVSGREKENGARLVESLRQDHFEWAALRLVKAFGPDRILKWTKRHGGNERIVKGKTRKYSLEGVRDGYEAIFQVVGIDLSSLPLAKRGPIGRRERQRRRL